MLKKAEILHSQDNIHRIKIGANSNVNDINELITMFFPPSSFELDTSGKPIATDKDELKRLVYNALVEETEEHLNWGILTGVKPLKLYSSIVQNHGISSANAIMKNEYYLSDKSIDLLSDTFNTQNNALGSPLPNSVSIYIGIPFCPSKCAYCSFTSNLATDDAIELYLEALYKEIDYVSDSMKESKLIAESIYIGGGTPTSISPDDMKKLLSRIRQKIPCLSSCEFTVEAGRPDTLTKEKCKILADNEIDRISINPQSMNTETLKRIGRNHDSEEIIRAFETAREVKEFSVNADIIAGLPGEDRRDFDRTISKILEIRPENVTIHTLSIKKGSELREVDAELCYNNKGLVSEMLADIYPHLACFGYKPYYLYRQKRMLDNLENVGYSLPKNECVYNIRIMEEKQTIIALGAGGSSKVYFPSEDRIERVFNVSNYEIYVNRIDEMIKRKEKGLFRPLKEI